MPRKPPPFHAVHPANIRPGTVKLTGPSDNRAMNTYKGNRFPPEIISYAVWLYHRVSLSHRDIEDLLAERDIIVSYDSIRLRCIKFGPKYARRLKRNHQGYGDTFYIDEVYVKLRGNQHYLWRAVDQDGEVVNVFLQDRRGGAAAKRFFIRLPQSHVGNPRKIVSDKLRSYWIAHRQLIPDTLHVTDQYAHNRAEQSHEPTRVRERGMRRFKSTGQAQRPLNIHAAVYNLFNPGRHLVSAPLSES